MRFADSTGAGRPIAETCLRRSQHYEPGSLLLPIIQIVLAHLPTILAQSSAERLEKECGDSHRYVDTHTIRGELVQWSVLQNYFRQRVARMLLLICWSSFRGITPSTERHRGDRNACNKKGCFSIAQSSEVMQTCPVWQRDCCVVIGKQDHSSAFRVSIFTKRT